MTAFTSVNSGTSDACQQGSTRHGSRLLHPYPVILMLNTLKYLRRAGPRATMLKISDFCRARFASRFAKGAGPRASGKMRDSAAHPFVLGLEPGDMVEVRSLAEIQGTLDRRGRLNGLAFLPDMAAYCGRSFKVYKRLNRVFLEESKQVRVMKNTVLLEGVVCGGAGIGCDRSCLYYWREAWLKRAVST